MLNVQVPPMFKSTCLIPAELGNSGPASHVDITSAQPWLTGFIPWNSVSTGFQLENGNQTQTKALQFFLIPSEKTLRDNHFFILIVTWIQNCATKHGFRWPDGPGS